MARRLLLLGVLLLTACAGRQPHRDMQASTSVAVVKATIEYLGPDRGSLPASHFPRAVRLVFPYLPGEIFGNPRPRPLFTSRLEGERGFEWRLEESLNALVGEARPLSAEWQRRGLSVTPAETRLARIGTFAFDAGTGESIGAGGFIDPVSKDSLILLYVDRACEIAGGFTLGDEHYLHDIRLAAPGFHWLRVVEDGPGVRKLVTHPADSEVRFSIHLLHLQRI